MSSVYASYSKYQYGIAGCSHIAAHFDSLEKAAKISYRVIDIAALLIVGISPSFTVLSSQIKDTILIIESTRFFPISFPLFFPNEAGKRFFQIKTKIQIAERIALAAHLVFKLAYGLDRVKLIALGIIGTYAIGYITLFRWLAEGLILSYNVFGALDGALALSRAGKKLESCQGKIDKWKMRHQIQSLDNNRSLNKLRKWEDIQRALRFDRNKASLQLIATVSKIILITVAVSLAAINLVTFSGQLTVLSLGIISDSFGLARIFFNEYFVTSC